MPEQILKWLLILVSASALGFVAFVLIWKMTNSAMIGLLLAGVVFFVVLCMERLK